MVLNSVPKIQEKEIVSSKEFGKRDVENYSIRIPFAMCDKLKYEIGRKTKASMRDLILKADEEYYKI